jgi:hypothetical protein
MSISVFAFKIGFVERDYQHPVLLVCLRVHDERDLAPEKRIDSDQTPWCLPVGAHTVPMVMSVVAKVGNNEGQVGRAFNCIEIALELVKWYVVCLAIFFTDGMKVHKGIVLGCVLTVASSSFMAIHFAQWWMLAGALHIFHVAAPFQMSRFELICDRADIGGIHASMPNCLPIRVEPRLDQNELVEYRTVLLRFWIRRLAAYHRDVVVETKMPDSIVVREQLSLLSEALRKVWSLGFWPKGLIIALILQNYDEYMLRAATRWMMNHRSR